MTDVQLNCYLYMAILGTILLCWLKLNWIVWSRTAWYLTLCKQMTDVQLNC